MEYKNIKDVLSIPEKLSKYVIIYLFDLDTRKPDSENHKA